jgi:hypothetical protein
MKYTGTYLAAALIAIIIAIILGPFITIWSLNTLFPALAIPYTLETWAAAIGLHATIRGIFYKKEK